jgi:hypothetical protein
MAKVLQNIFTPSVDEIAQTYTIESWHVSQSVDALTGADDYDITISGSLIVTGSTSILGNVSTTGNSTTTGYSTVGNVITYATGDNLAIVDSASFTPSIDLGVLRNIRIGYAAGQDTPRTSFSTIIGASAGISAQSASYSNFIGNAAGGFAKYASGSNFIGYLAGYFAASASYSNLFGYNVGRGDIDGNTIGPNNIIIGTNISLPFNYRNGINIGGILFGSGSYGTPSGNVFSGSVGNGRIGINQPTPSFNLDVSGSGNFTNGLSLTGSLSTTGSVTLRGLTTTAKSFVVTIDNTTGQLFYTSSAGFIAGAVSPSGSPGQIQYNNAGAFGGVPNLTWNGTTLTATGSFTGSFIGAFTGNLTGTASRATTSSYADNYRINYNDSTSGGFSLLYGLGGTQAYGNSSIYVNPSSSKLYSPTFVSSKAWNGNNGEGGLYLTGTTGVRIDFDSVGGGVPTFTTRSLGTRLMLFPGIGPAAVDYAIGLENLYIWNSVPTSDYGFKWYGGTTNIATLSGSGTFSLNRSWGSTDGSGQIFLNGSTGNRIEFAQPGFGPPSTGTTGGVGRSVGTKIVLYPGVGFNASSVDYAIGIDVDSLWHSVATSTDTFKWYAGATNIAQLAGDGTLYLTGDVVTSWSSDKNLKDNITPISNPIEKIQKIGGYEFDWNDKQNVYEGHDIGVVAQEIEEVLPEIVTTRDNGYKAVKYEKIVALLIEAIKDQQNQINELKSRIG